MRLPIRHYSNYVRISYRLDLENDMFSSLVGSGESVRISGRNLPGNNYVDGATVYERIVKISFYPKFNRF